MTGLTVISVFQRSNHLEGLLVRPSTKKK
jgi:hypothetical protein